MSAFKDSFELVGLRHTRCDKPTCALAPERHHEWTLGELVGKVHHDVYADHAAGKFYARLYRLADGEVAWYLLTLECAA